MQMMYDRNKRSKKPTLKVELLKSQEFVKKKLGFATAPWCLATSVRGKSEARIWTSIE
jgi:hypothetical protein